MEAPKIQKVTIYYRRLPNNIAQIPAILLYDSEEVIISLNLLSPSKPLIINDVTLLDKDYIGVWFASTQEWHDLGAIYDLEKNFKGYYCDICTPMKRVSDGFECTDFFLDLWIYPNGQYFILDKEEYHQAVKKKWIAVNQQEKVEAELQCLIDMVKSKRFPPSKMKNQLELPQNINEIVHALKQFKNKA